MLASGRGRNTRYNKRRQAKKSSNTLIDAVTASATLVTLVNPAASVFELADTVEHEFEAVQTEVASCFRMASSMLSVEPVLKSLALVPLAPRVLPKIPKHDRHLKLAYFDIPAECALDAATPRAAHRVGTARRVTVNAYDPVEVVINVETKPAIFGVFPLATDGPQTETQPKPVAPGAGLQVAEESQSETLQDAPTMMIDAADASGDLQPEGGESTVPSDMNTDFEHSEETKSEGLQNSIKAILDSMMDFSCCSNTESAEKGMTSAASVMNSDLEPIEEAESEGLQDAIAAAFDSMMDLSEGTESEGAEADSASVVQRDFEHPEERQCENLQNTWEAAINALFGLPTKIEFKDAETDVTATAEADAAEPQSESLETVVEVVSEPDTKTVEGQPDAGRTVVEDVLLNVDEVSGDDAEKTVEPRGLAAEADVDLEAAEDQPAEAEPVESNTNAEADQQGAANEIPAQAADYVLDAITISAGGFESTADSASETLEVPPEEHLAPISLDGVPDAANMLEKVKSGGIDVVKVNGGFVMKRFRLKW